MDGLMLGILASAALIVIAAVSWDNRHQHHVWTDEDDPTVIDRPPTTDE
jgi:hypothetical protein